MSTSTKFLKERLAEVQRIIPQDSYILSGAEMRALVDHLGGWAPLAEVLGKGREQEAEGDGG